MIEPPAHESAERGLLERVCIHIPKGAQVRGASARFIDLREGVDRAVHEQGNAVRLGKAIELHALLERGDVALIAVWGEDQRGEAPLVEPLHEELPCVEIVFGEVGGVVGGFFEAAIEHLLEDFSRVAEELFVHYVEFLVGPRVDAYDFGAQLSGQISVDDPETRA